MAIVGSLDRTARVDNPTMRGQLMPEKKSGGMGGKRSGAKKAAKKATKKAATKVVKKAAKKVAKKKK